MIVYVAREGVEIGAYERTELERYSHTGDLQPTDHYWHQGMSDWLLLGELLGPEAWEPLAEGPPAPRELPPRSVIYLAGALCAFAAIALFIGYKLATSGSSQRPAVQSPQLSRTDSALLREKATDELVAKLNQLPTVAAPPLNLFYYALKVVFPEPPSALTATVTGAEDVVDPATQTNRWHTPFILTLEYRNTEWTYRDYRGSTTDMSNGTVMEIDGSRKAAIQPTIVSLLGIKEAPDRIEHE